MSRLVALAASLILAMLWPYTLPAQTRANSGTFVEPPIVLTVEGTNVWIQRFRSNVWSSAYPKQILGVRDRGRTGADSRTSIRLSDLSVLRIGWHSEFEIQPLPEPDVDAEFSLMRGLMRLLNRDRPGKHRFVTPTATAATRGTEFVLKVEEDTGRTTLTVFEGEADLRNALGSVRLAGGEQGIAEAGQPPIKTAVIDATAIVQWCLYYPGVLDLTELDLTPAEESALSASLAEYRNGDLLRALSAYPAGRTPATDSERIYLAALLLSVGQVGQSESLLDSLNEIDPSSRMRRLADALRLVVDAVNLRPRSSTLNPQPSTLLASELLAESYYYQSQFQLAPALESARLCAEQSPDFAFGWARVAELEFGFGRIKPALAALDSSLAQAPRNAQAVALRGFLLSAQNRIGNAAEWFEKAIEIDGGLGNAWLGRGLCRIRKGDEHEGRFDLQVAASMEPQRSLLRSYLGKAFSNARDTRHAEKELAIAKELDLNDPTPWLYSALLLRDLNRINESVRDLERSQQLNDNRRVYRSRLLLDQDRAVRGANLARVYRDAGMTDVSVREAGRAVNADYANHSAHRFLANSYNELRDINQINLRHETAWFTQYLLANLLAPVGAGPLSQNVSQQEYSKLFQRDGMGLTSSTEYFSHGEWIQSAAQHGTFGNSSYAAEFFYHHDNGHRPNNDLEQFSAVVNLKQQFTPQDSVYLRLNYSENEYGDVNQYYDQKSANPGLRSRERFEPSLLAGYHREWNPGSHTLLLAGRLGVDYEINNPLQATLFLNRGFVGNPVQSVTPLFYDQEHRRELELYLGELQHIWQWESHSLVVGGRLQAGEIRTRNIQTNGVLTDGFATNALPFSPDQNITGDMVRGSVYVYDHWQVWDALMLAGGLSYDWVRFPENYGFPPVSNSSEARDQISPKIGLIWTPANHTTLRAAYFRGLGGVTLDQSIRLEPSQVAGFNQAYRSLIPEAVAGAGAAPTFEGWAISLEQKFGKGTFAGVSGELLSSEVDRTIGVVESAVSFSGPPFPFSAQGTRQVLDFREKSLTFTLNQLLGDEWSLGASYRISHAELDDRFPDIPSTATLNGGIQTERNLEATLHQARLFALFNHASGFFARAGAIWTSQNNRGYTPARPGDDFWQFNIEGGYRFAQRRAELRLGLLNLTDQDYQLNPLNLTQDLPRERTVAVSVQFNF
jgi:Flp pilus assembly protein TadD